MRNFIFVAALSFISGAAFAGPVSESLVKVQNNSNMHVFSTCGNGHLDPGEVCDGTVNCKADCSGQIGYVYYTCGDGTINYGDVCDDGNGVTTDACPSGKDGNCRPAKCGDGYIWEGHEECDGGENCTDDCKLIVEQNNPPPEPVNQPQEQGQGGTSGSSGNTTPSEKVFTNDSGEHAPGSSQGAADAQAGGCSLIGAEVRSVAIPMIFAHRAVDVLLPSR